MLVRVRIGRLRTAHVTSGVLVERDRALLREPVARQRVLHRGDNPTSTRDLDGMSDATSGDAA